MVMHRMGLALIATMGGGTAAAQSPMTLSSGIETGWTSNATDSAAGGADFYVSHSHELSLSGQNENLLLRGSFAVSQTRFALMSFEDDAEVTGAVEGQLALGADATLRLGYAATQRWTGDDLWLAGLMVPVRSGEAEHEYLAEFTLRGRDQQASVAVMADWTLPDDSTLDGLGLPPLRLAPRVGSVTGRVDWERALSPSMAVLAGMETWFTLIPETDRAVYLRAPADGGRVSAGLRLAGEGWAAEGRGGADFVWPTGLSALTRTMPYASLAASIMPMAGVTLALEGESGVELADPVDGVAGRTAAVEFGATWQVTPKVVLSAELSARQEWGLFEEGMRRSARMAMLGLNYAVSDRFAYRAALSWSRHDEQDDGYDKAGIALSLTGQI